MTGKIFFFKRKIGTVGCGQTEVESNGENWHCLLGTAAGSRRKDFPTKAIRKGRRDAPEIQPTQA
jgi:hypothetical protein